MIILLIADGRSTHTQRWAEYFAHRGHDVHLITYDPMNVVINGVTEHVLLSRWDNLYLSFIPRHMAIKHLVKKIKPDIMHAHFIAKYGFHMPNLGFRPSIVSAWGDDILILPLKNRLIRYYSQKVLQYADLIYAISHNISNHIVSDFNISAEKIHYLPFGVDTDLFTPRSEKKATDSLTIEIFSNRGFYPVYDSETLVKGFAIAYQKERRLRLTLKGEGPDEQKIRNLVASLGISDVVTFRQKTHFSKVPQDYRNADIFVTTSRSDGTPVSILEAMASALPCIATTVGGIPEWIENQKNGLLIPPGSPRQLAEKILLLAQNPQLGLALGNAAREKIKKDGQWYTLMAAAEKDYQALIRTYKRDTP
jgi:glycosyltransferase involved in cell wall biosynthesis